MPDKSPFVHLHLHSHYSLLEALTKTKPLIKAIKEREMDTFALTDNGVLYGVIDFYRKCKDEELKLIVGLDAYLASNGRHQKRGKMDAKPNRLVLLVENMAGYKNLVQLSSISFIEGFYYKPRMDKELLKEFCQGKEHGLIALSGGRFGDIDQAIVNENLDEAKRLILEYQEIFGPNNFFLELVDRPEIPEQEATNAKLAELGKELGVPIVATKNVFYLKPQDSEAWKILQCVKDGRTLDMFERVQSYDYDASLVDADYMISRFKDLPEAIENTRKIADRCELQFELDQWNFADFEAPEGLTHLEFLRQRAFNELPEKIGCEVLTQEMIDRLDYELSVIEFKGFAPYFLIVSDYIEWARKNGIMTTTRGSAAGSLVGFSIGISTVNPLKYKLPFERFLNPERPSAPDVDGDFADNRRDEMLAYVTEKYGKDKVAQICTFGTMLARGSIRDVGRALGYEYSFVDLVAKLVPMGSQGFPMNLKRALEETPELKTRYDTEPDVRRLINLAQQIEGCARHVSIHAAGVVISPTPLTDFTPLQIESKEGRVITQYEMKSVESAGLLKMDFLGIRNLSILGDAVRIIRKVKGVDIQIEKIPVDDKKTFELLANGYTMGTFQLNGDGMTKYLMELKPTRIEDIMVMVALYRPGPIESIPEYIRRKYDPSLIKYLDPRLKEIIDTSYGVIVYQDDVMLISIKLGGYSWLEADKLRKAMGKKIPEEMAKQKEKLLAGLVKNGLDKRKADELWKLIEPFAAYGFNKCLAGETRVFNPQDGSYKTIAELYKKGDGGQILALQNNWSLKKEAHLKVVENGRKQIYKLITRSGRQIRATNNHPFLKFEGWTRLDKLKIGDRLAVPRSLSCGSGVGLSKSKARVLGYLIAEGNLCHPHGVYFYSKSEAEIRDFIVSVKTFDNIKITIDRSKAATSVYVGQENKTVGNLLFRWLKQLDLINKKASEKILPEIVYRMNSEELGELLAGMWQGDGCVHADRDGQIYYATSSEKLAGQVQHLLLRLSIISTIHKKKFRYRGGLKFGFTVNVSQKENLEKFYQVIGRRLLKEKREAAAKIITRVRRVYRGNEGIIARGTKDIVPVEVFSLIRSEISRLGFSPSEAAHRTGLSSRLFFLDRRRIGYSRPVIAKMAKVFKSSELLVLASSEVYWDEIVSIEKDGFEMTYDLEVPKSHNFIANDFIVHNSHAASYGMVAYQTAYLKANYPAEYMSALMTAESNDLETISDAVKECQRMNIAVLPPDINESLPNFTYIDDNTIRFGLVVIKNLGKEVVETIVAERQENGLFKDLADFASRVHHRAFNKKAIDALIKAGALDCFGERRCLLENLEQIMSFNKESKEKQAQNQSSLFDLSPSLATEKLKLRPTPPAEKKELLSWEKELLGLYISSHPYDDIGKQLGSYLMPLKNLQTQPDNSFVKCGGLITSVKTIITKKGDNMAFVGIDDKDGKAEVIVFPSVYSQFSKILLEDQVLLISAKVSRRDGEEAKLLGNSFIVADDERLPDLAAMLQDGLWVPDDGSRPVSAPVQKIPQPKNLLMSATPPPKTTSNKVEITLIGKPDPELIANLRELFSFSPGSKKVKFILDTAGAKRIVDTDYSVDPTPEFVSKIKKLVGERNIVL